MEHKDFTPQVRDAQVCWPVYKNEKPYALYNRYDPGTEYGTLIATEDKAKIVGQALNAFGRVETYLQMAAAISATAALVDNKSLWVNWENLHGHGVDYYALIGRFSVICTEMFFAAQAAFPEGLGGVWAYEVAEEFGSDLRQSIEGSIEGVVYSEEVLRKSMFADACNFVDNTTGETCPDTLVKEFRRIARI